MKLLYLILSLILSVFIGQAGVFGEEASLLTFSELAAFEDSSYRSSSKVQIRGFLYSVPDSAQPLILSKEPNVKSCCVNRLEQKIEIFGEIDPQKMTSHAVLLEGVLSVEYQKEGHGAPKFKLLNARVVEEHTHSFFWISTTLVFCFLLLAYFFVQRLPFRIRQHLQQFPLKKISQ